MFAARLAVFILTLGLATAPAVAQDAATPPTDPGVAAPGELAQPDAPPIMPPTEVPPAADTAPPVPEASVSAPTFESLVAELASADFGRKLEIATALAASGNPRAEPILTALIDGALYFTHDGVAVIGGPNNNYTNALTGEVLKGVDAATLKKVNVNNRLRKALRGLIARLSLSSPDEAARRAAAASVFTSADPDLLPAIDEALARETVSDIRDRLAQARAVIILRDATSSSEDKLAAIEVLKDRGDVEALNVLMSIGEGQSDRVKAAVASAIESIQASLARWGALQNIYYGLSLGSVLLLAAIGLAITFGVMGIINMAHGELIMLGAYTTYLVQQIIAAVAPDLMNLSLALAVPAAFIVSGGVGILIERGVIRFLYGRPLETLLATWGVSLILQQAIRTIFGPTNKPVIAPDWMSGAFQIGQLSITYSRLWIIVFAIGVLFLLMGFLKRTYFGMQMRAVTQNRKMAASMGVRTNWVDALTFGLGSGIAGIAGVALSQIDNISPNLGQSYIIDSFMVVVFGGVGNLWGTFVGAMTLGVANKFLEPYAGAVLGKILVLVFIILFIQRRPRGLFALKGRAVEA